MGLNDESQFWWHYMINTTPSNSMLQTTGFRRNQCPCLKTHHFHYHISPVRKNGWNVNHLVVVATFLNPEIGHDEIYMTLPECWPAGLNPPPIIVQLKKKLYGHKQAPHLWHNTINTFLHSLKFTQYLADPNNYLSSEGILMLLGVHIISILYPEDASKAAVQSKASFSE